MITKRAFAFHRRTAQSHGDFYPQKKSIIKIVLENRRHFKRYTSQQRRWQSETVAIKKLESSELNLVENICDQRLPTIKSKIDVLMAGKRRQRCAHKHEQTDQQIDKRKSNVVAAATLFSACETKRADRPTK